MCVCGGVWVCVCSMRECMCVCARISIIYVLKYREEGGEKGETGREERWGGRKEERGKEKGMKGGGKRGGEG